MTFGARWARREAPHHVIITVRGRGYRSTTMLAEAVQIAERYGMHGLRRTAIRVLHTNGR